MLSLYLHIPFCASKCSYCDFNAYAGMSDLIAPYARALAKEVRMVGEAGGPEGAGERGEVHTLFFGGGTPSLTPLDSMADIFSAIRESFALTDDCEVTLEANPGTVDLAYLEGLRALGVNRLSFGVQSAQANELSLFYRIHTFDEACETVRLARQAGFDRQSYGVNLDLIYGIPGQTPERWKDTLARALALEPEHLSLYSLSLEFGTPMRAWVQRGLLPAPDNNVAADMYEWADAELARAGFEQYEISNWARTKDEGGRMKDEIQCTILPPSSFRFPAFACRHNLQYWRNEPYLGFGAGAHGCISGFRYSNVLSPAAYIQRIESGEARPFPFSPALAEATPVDVKTAMDETMLLGFRLTREGIPADAFRARYGVGFDEVYARELRDLTGRQLIEVGADRARLRPGARLVANRVFEKFV
ncbi:MAG: radical SAM family heme chaperone HemW [Chloroflexi bacterium]|nr:radical SAM family heme chaperone HemW [Chloroflexota bacterium]